MADDSSFETQMPESARLSSMEPPPLSSRAREIMCYSFMHVFAKAQVTREQLAFIDRLARHDQQIDSQEREVLTAVFARIGRENLDDDVRQELEQLKVEYGIE